MSGMSNMSEEELVAACLGLLREAPDAYAALQAAIESDDEPDDREKWR